MDRFGLNLGRTTFESRAATLVEMCRRGYAGSMVVSHDASCYIDWLDPALLPFLPRWHYLHLGHDVLPYVQARGVSAGQVETMLAEVPRRLFEAAERPGA
jgi:phosphotriesterase-related protein